MSKVVERLINLLAYLLDSSRPVTAEQIRDTVAGYGQSSDQAFRRMFERDKAGLRGLGIELELRATDAWEVEWGYVIADESYRTIDPGLTEGERTALALAVHMVRTGAWPAGADALLKLGGARFVQAGRPVGADLGLDSDRVGLVFEAVMERRRLRFSYRGRTRILEPYGMRHQRGHWYFAGTEPERPGGVRTYRLDRAGEMRMEGPSEAFERPRGFSTRDILSSLPWEEGEQSVARVRFDPEVAWWVENRFPDARVVEQAPDGSTVLDVPYFVSESFINLILGMDDAAVILHPPELRDGLISRIREKPLTSRARPGARTRAGRADQSDQGKAVSATATQRRLMRILSMVPWVIAHPYPRVSEVMERFGYRTRVTLAKDLALLFVCGVPGYGPEDLMVAFIDDDRVILDMADYFSRPLKLTPPEALGLLSAGMAVAGTSQAGPDLAGAVDKLVAALFPDQPEVIGADLPPEPPHLDTLRRAAAEGRVVEITYLSVGANRTTVREVEPTMVYASMGRWYLSARCRLARDRRTFRVDRIRSLEERSDRFAPPPVADHPEVGFTASADAVYAILALSPPAGWVTEYYPVEVIRDTGKVLLVRFAMSAPRVAARLLLRLGGKARLIEGEEVAREMERLRRAILDRYGEA